jgi:hypothetical protein
MLLMGFISGVISENKGSAPKPYLKTSCLGPGLAWREEGQVMWKRASIGGRVALQGSADPEEPHEVWYIRVWLTARLLPQPRMI